MQPEITFETGKALNKALYAVGVVAIFFCVYFQYFVHLTSLEGYLVVYGIPVAVVLAIFGKQMLGRAAKNNKAAGQYGLGLFGVLSSTGIFLAVVAVIIISQFTPDVQTLLSKPNPVLNVPPSEAWVLIGISFLIVGPAEELLFRGFMFGGLLSISRGKHWVPITVASSALFAAVHAYYAVTYGVVSAVAFIQLITFGVAMCITYYWSGGNLIIPALLHGAFDATGFLGVATTPLIGNIARGVLIGVGLVFAGIYLPKKLRVTYPPQEKTPPPSPAENPPPPETPPPNTSTTCVF